MAAQLFSQNWYRVAPLKPRLRGDVAIHEQVHRGVRWHIVEDKQSGRFHRLTPAAYFIVCMMDGERDMRAIWSLAERRFGRDVPTQDEVIRLLAQLHGADLLIGDNLPDLQEIDRRAVEIARRNVLARVRNPMALRIPLLDPDRFVEATMPLVRPLFSVVGALLWLALVLAGVVQTVLVWPELTSDLTDRVLATQGLALIALVYPVVKAVHELGHAYAVKRWGGEVHELGIMFLVLIPVPYVDASASLAFRSRWQRALVGGAGILIELALAAAAILIWARIEPGLVRAALFNVALIGGVSTLLFNGNPLLRFDGYYVFSDLIGIPNLGTRSNRYLGYLVQRYAFGRTDAESPVVAPSERLWLAAYAVASFLYRLTVMTAIAVFIAGRFFVIGVLLAMLVVANMLVVPMLKGVSFVATSQALQGHRGRAIGTTLLAAVSLVGAILFVPLPRSSFAPAIVWMSPEGAVRTGTAGEVAQALAVPNGPVLAGQPLLQLADLRLDAMVRVQAAHLASLEASYASASVGDLRQARVLASTIDQAQEELRRLEERRAVLEVRAPRDGIWTIAAPADLVGRFLGRGASAGYVLQPGDRRIRAVVTQSEVDLIRSATVAATVRLAGDMAHTYPARIVREIPAGDRVLPSEAFATGAGGSLALDPRSADAPRALETLFQFDLVLEDAPDGGLLPGERAYVRFEHPATPLGVRLYTATRRLFLASFDV